MSSDSENNEKEISTDVGTISEDTGDNIISEELVEKVEEVEKEEEEDVVLEDMEAPSFYAVAPQADYEAKFVYKHPSQETETTEYGTFEEMWTRCYQEATGTVTIYQDVVAHELTRADGKTIVGFGTGKAFTGGGSIKMPFHRYEEGTEGYTWPSINLNGYTLDANHSPNDVQYDTGEVCYWAPGCWGNVHNGKIINSSKSAFRFLGDNSGANAGNGRGVISRLEFINCYSQYGGAIYKDGGLITAHDIKIHDCGAWYGGGAIYMKRANISMYGDDIYINDNYILTPDISYGAPSAVKTADNICFASEELQYLYISAKASGTIGITSKQDRTKFQDVVSFDTMDIMNASNIEFISDDPNYVFVNSESSSRRLALVASDDKKATSDAYWCKSEKDPEEQRFYGTIQEVWDYACEKKSGNVILLKNVYRKISNEPGAPDFPVFGWGENFTEDGAFLVKSKDGEKIEGLYFALCNHQINGLYDGNVPDSNGIGHVFVLDGSNGYVSLNITGWNSKGGTFDNEIKTINEQTQGIIRNTGASAIWIKENAFVNLWQVAFDNCYGEYGGAINVDGGYLDGGKVFIQQCKATESGGAIYCNSQKERTVTIYSRDKYPSTDTGERHTYKGIYMMSGWTVKNNIKIDSDGNKISNDNIHLCLDNKMAWAPPMKYNIGVNAEMKEIGGSFPKAEIAINLGAGNSDEWNNHHISADDNENFQADVYDTQVNPTQGWNGDNFFYYAERYEAYASLQGWDHYDVVGTLEDVWNWAAEQSQKNVYVMFNKSITASVREESGYPDYPVFGMGPGFSDTGELIVDNGKSIWLHLHGNYFFNRNMQSYDATEKGYGFVTIKNGSSLRIQCVTGSPSALTNCASSAIRIEKGGILNAFNLEIRNCKAIDGAGIWNQGEAQFDWSLYLQKNTAVNRGGGIFNDGILKIESLGSSMLDSNTSGSGNKFKKDNVYLTSGHYIEPIGNVGVKHESICFIGIRSEDADNNKEAIAVKDYFTKQQDGISFDEYIIPDNLLINGFKQQGNDLVFDLSREPQYLTNKEISCMVFDGASWYETGTIKEGILKAQFNDSDGYLFYVESDKVSEVYKEWGFDIKNIKTNEIGFGTREDNGTDTITNIIKPITKDGKVYIPVGIITEYSYDADNLKLYYTPSCKAYNHKEINYANLNEFRPDGRVQISIIDRNNNVKRESFGLDQPYETTVDWLDGYEWFVYYLNGLPFNESILTRTYNGFKLNLKMKSVPYPLIIRESQAKHVFNVVLKASVDGEILNFDRLPDVQGPKLYDGDAQFYISAKVLDDYISAFGFDSGQYNGEKIFGYKLKGSDEIVPLDVRKGENGDWEFLLPNPGKDPYGFDDGELYLFSRESDEIHHVGETFPEDISFYSVRVDDILGRNDWHYTDLSTTYYVASNDPFHISLPARSAGSWTCSVDADIRTAAGGMYMTISIPKVTQPTVLTCGENGGMEYTVQYYGALEQLDYVDPGDAAYDNSFKNQWGTYRWDDRMTKGIIDVINTSGAVLPDNTWSHKAAKTRQISVIKNGSNAGYIKSHTELLPLNKQKDYLYEATPSLSTVLRTYRGSNYEITELWVLKNEDDLRKEWEEQHPEPEEPNPENPDNTGEGTGTEEPTEPEVPDFTPASPDSTNRDDWTIYTKADLGVEDFSHVKLMNIPTEGHEGVLQIREGDVLRFIYTPVESTHEAEVRFYDYDITDGYWYDTAADATNRVNGHPMNTLNATVEKPAYFMTKESGINSPINHKDRSKAIYQFGNGNHDAGNNEAQSPDGANINIANTKYKGDAYGIARLSCFGIAKGLDGNNNIIYNDGISVPALFDEDTSTAVLGKTTLIGYKLDFKREGDVFTLSGVQDPDGNKVLSNLDKLANPTSAITHIWTNNFYPLDTYVQNNPDGHDPMYTPTAMRNAFKTYENKSLPPSDDEKYHNHFFGMHYEIRFRMPEDYIGPMEYVFFGDDDLWVFLDEQMVMDIGGVHPSAGEYLNLWDYIEQGDTSEHKLSVFYTERGASGSTCFMRFIIPNARFMDMGLSNLTGAIYLEKSAVAARDTNKDYKFHISLKDENGNPYVYETLDGSDASQGQPYIIYDSKNNVKTTGFITGGELDFTLKDMESMLIPGVKRGTHYQIDEEPELDMDTWVQKYGTESLRQHWIKGTVTGMSVEEVLYTNTWEESYEETEKLPDTGGTPYMGYLIGMAFLLAGCGLFIKKKQSK